MPLQQLVEYFNDRLEQEHQHEVRIFVLKDQLVHGLYGPISVSTVLSPIRESICESEYLGYSAQLQVTANDQTQALAPEWSENLTLPAEQAVGVNSIINFDRLSRTVHMLNYLPHAHLDKLLFLEVDPRHILGVKEDHGAYFEEIIIKCGLQTSNVVISLTVNSVYARLYPLLLRGLENYQRRGYRLALKLEIAVLQEAELELITRIAPDFIGLSAQLLTKEQNSRYLEILPQITRLAASLNGRSILFDVDNLESQHLARQTGFDLVQGDYFSQITEVSENYQRAVV